MSNPRHHKDPTQSLLRAKGHEKIAHWLSLGADPNAVNAKGISPLLNAARLGDEKSVRVLLDAGAHLPLPSAKGETIGLCVARSGSVECLKMLIGKGVDPLSCAEDGRTTLMVSVHPVMIEFLLSAGVRVDAVDNAGRTALHYLASCDGFVSRKVFELICGAGCNVDVIDHNGDSALLLANRYEKAICLLELGADPTACDKEGDTFLHRMFKKYQVNDFFLEDVLRIIDLAVAQGVDPMALNDKGETPGSRVVLPWRQPNQAQGAVLSHLEACAIRLNAQPGDARPRLRGRI